MKAWSEFERDLMNSLPILVSTLINRECFAKTLVDTRCLSYGIIDSRFARKYNLSRISIAPRALTGFDGPVTGEINEVIAVRIDINGHIEEKVFFYVVLRLATYDLILRML